MLKFVSNLLLAVSAASENPHPSCSTSSKAQPPKPAQPSLVEMLHELKLSDQQELFFMQLPDCMPGRVSAQSTDSLFGSPTTDMRTRPLHGQVSMFCLSHALQITKFQVLRNLVLVSVF